MAILARRQSLLFLMAPRTGCTAVGDVLCSELGGNYLPAEDQLDDLGVFRLQKKHNNVSELIDHGFLSTETAAALFKFTCVRNPFDSLVSFYVKKRTKYQPLLEDPSSWIYRAPGYVEDMHFCREHSFDEWIARRYRQGPLKRIVRPKRRSLSRKYTEGVDFVMRYERLQADFDEVLRRAGVDRRLTIPRVNATDEKTRNYRDYYSPTSRRIVERAFSEELRQYGYSF